MKFTSAMFLVLLLAQSAFTKVDVMTLLENSDAGKEVFQNLFLQMSAAGTNFDAKTVGETLKQMESAMRTANTDRKSAMATDKKNCVADIKKVKDVFVDLSQRTLTIGRAVKELKNREARRTLFLNNANTELANYKQFESWTKKNSEEWNAFYKIAADSMTKVQGLLAETTAMVKALPAEASAFVELPGSYTSSLSQIKSQFDANNDNLGGLRSAISNVLELVQSKENMKVTGFSDKVQMVIRHIDEKLGEFLNSHAEENEHQMAVNENYFNFFKDILERQDKLVKALTAESTKAKAKLIWLETTEKKDIATAAAGKQIVQDAALSCRTRFEDNNAKLARSQKVISVIGNLRDVIADRWNELEGAFAQKLQMETQ